MLPWSDLVTGADEDDGGLKRHPALPEESPTATESDRTPDAGLLDDEFDATDAKQVDQLARNTTVVRRAHAMDQADDDLIPSF